MNTEKQNTGTHRRIVILLIAAVCLVLISVVYYISNSNREKSDHLTMEIVKELSQKGEQLTWEDFKDYQGTEIGSGLYIMRYPIDEEYSLLVGAGGPSEKLMYVYLVSNRDDQKRIDIRHEDIDKFLNSIE